MHSNWYEEFFHGLALDLWRKAVTEEQTEAEADFIAGILDLPNGARILDVPCYYVPVCCYEPSGAYKEPASKDCWEGGFVGPVLNLVMKSTTLGLILANKSVNSIARSCCS